MTVQKIKILNDRGEEVEAIAPVIISASRSTDIPTYFSKWFVHRFNSGKGYITWYNPFNQKPLHVSFRNTKIIVFWTKNPKPMLPYLQELDNSGVHYYFQFTLNDYYREGFEPNVPSVSNRIETFKRLSDKIGPDRVIWRFDPILFTKTLPPYEVASRIFRISKELKNYTNKLVVSFIDICNYKKVQRNLLKYSSVLASQYDTKTISSVEPTNEQIKEFCSYLKKIKDYWTERGWNLEISTCAESVDLEAFDITHNKCIDGELMLRLFGSDPELREYLTGKTSEDKMDLFEAFNENSKKVIVIKKDKGQRKECGCIESKDIGMYNTCLNGCIYCYANTSREAAQKNFKKRKETPYAERIWLP